MQVNDGGASFSLIICDQDLTFDDINILKKIEGVENILAGDNAFTVIFRVNSFLDINPSTVINAQQNIKRTLRNLTCHKSSLSDPGRHMKGMLRQK